VAAAPVLRAQSEKLPLNDLIYVQHTWPKAKETFTGMRYIVERPGRGAPARSGDLVSVLYVGRLLHGAVFDKVTDPDHPFTFRVDRFEVIPGWDQALERMSVGEKMLIILPSDLGYGFRGSPPQIPPGATLVFTIQLLKIDREN
jgi:FKBP-type peptidyl-prolyl cis-trans isomerase